MVLVRGELHQHDAMGRHGRRKAVAAHRRRLMLPQVAQFQILACEARWQARSWKRNLCRSFRAIEETDDNRAIRERTHQTPQDHCCSTPKPPVCSAVLVDRDHLAIHQDALRLVGHRTQVVARDQRRGQQRPQAHVRAVLIGRHAAVADLQHVGIIPVPGFGIGGDLELAEANAVHGLPAVADIAGRAPQIAARFLAPTGPQARRDRIRRGCKQ